MEFFKVEKDSTIKPASLMEGRFFLQEFIRDIWGFVSPQVNIYCPQKENSSKIPEKGILVD